MEHVDSVTLHHYPSGHIWHLAHFRKHKRCIQIGAADNKMGYSSFLPTTHIMHIMHTITAPNAITAGAGCQPLTPILIHTSTSFPIDAADNSIATPHIHFAMDLPVIRSPVLTQDEMVLTMHMAGCTQTPICRCVKVAYKEVCICPPVLRRFWTATFGLFE